MTANASSAYVKHLKAIISVLSKTVKLIPLFKRNGELRFLFPLP